MVREYKRTTAPIAPNCIAMIKLEKKALSGTPKIREAITRCAVEEIGKNSVRPSTTPSMTACAISTLP